LPRLAPSAAYHCIPVLDLTVPSQKQLQAAVAIVEEWHRAGRTVLVCCALGYSRSALVAAAWLSGHLGLSDPSEALAHLRRSRPAVVLGPQSVGALATYMRQHSALAATGAAMQRACHAD
jgi:protein-tyrosine phosphatase